MTKGIACPECASTDSGVIDSRPNTAGFRRRRVCKCGAAFMTQEVVVNGDAIVVHAGSTGRPSRVLALSKLLRMLDIGLTARVSADIDRLAVQFTRHEDDHAR